MAVEIDSYTVYENETSTIVKSGTFKEIEEYLDDDSHSIEGYTVVWNFNGYQL